MQERIRYVEKRSNRNGRTRWYWRRRGHPVTRLPDDPADRLRMATRLNEAADREENGRSHPPGSVAWVCEKYRASDRWKDLAPGTVKYYARYLADIEDAGRDLPFGEAWTRKVVVDFLESYPDKDRRKVASVLRNVFHVAMYHGYGCPTA